jgi:hypothetical protein
MSIKGLLGLSLVLVSAAPIAAQSTGTPVFQAPYRAFAGSEIGLSLSDPGNGFALEGSYRTGFSPRLDLGIRAGIADGRGSSALLVGSDLRMRVLDHSESFPLDGSFTVGLGLASGDGYTVGYLPIGFTMGRRILVEGSSVSLVPYLHPVITPVFGDASDALLSIGFGVDARITPRLDIRFSAAFGDQDGIAFTVAFLR